MQDTSQFIMMPIPASQYTAVCALLGGTLARIAADTPPTHEPTPAPIDAAHPPAAASTEQLEAVDQSPPVNDAEIDSAGVSFDEAIHTGTKLKDGTWRAKKGMKQEAEKLAEGTKTEEAKVEEPAKETKADEDEFAAFRQAVDESDEAEQAEPEPRKWTEADLSKLCNQAATKLGDPGPIKNVISSFVPEGETPHSRNIPSDQREAFASAVEKAADIEFAG